MSHMPQSYDPSSIQMKLIHSHRAVGSGAISLSVEYNVAYRNTTTDVFLLSAQHDITPI